VLTERGPVVRISRFDGAGCGTRSESNAVPWTACRCKKAVVSELAAAARLIYEDCLNAEATENPSVVLPVMMIEALRGQGQEASELVDARLAERWIDGAVGPRDPR
jgi:hypothetical protein